ncbi:MAG: 2TM domain-containing protein [bacterium]|nr:2TM domain-containing protein [bacterium]
MRQETDLNGRQFTNDEVQEIVRRSLNRQKGTDTVSYEELEETAREVGVDPEVLRGVVAEQAQRGDRKEAKTVWMRQRRSQFRGHLFAYLIVNGALFLFNCFTPGVWWFQWPLVGWGIGLAFDFMDTFSPSEDAIEKGIRKTMKKLHKDRWRLPVDDDA